LPAISEVIEWKRCPQRRAAQFEAVRPHSPLQEVSRRSDHPEAVRQEPGPSTLSAIRLQRRRGNAMSDEILGVIIGGAIGIVGSLLGVVANHLLAARRDEIQRKREDSRRWTDGVSDLISVPRSLRPRLHPLPRVLPTAQVEREFPAISQSAKRLVNRLEALRVRRKAVSPRVMEQVKLNVDQLQGLLDLLAEGKTAASNVTKGPTIGPIDRLG